MPTHYVVMSFTQAIGVVCSPSLEHTFAEEILSERRGSSGATDKEAPAPQNAPNIVKQTADRS